ncbi:MAG: Ig-like domain-containing protein [Oscillospiraceae bacterium]|nr:Ig-like domain-containing protein [Oscillospiraceae bacterium]
MTNKTKAVIICAVCLGIILSLALIASFRGGVEEPAASPTSATPEVSDDSAEMDEPIIELPDEKPENQDSELHIGIGDEPPGANGGQLEKLTLNKDKLTLTKGNTYKMQVNVSPDSITWSSSNTKTAEVSENGTITGIEAGTATITAKTPDGKTAQCTVTVKTPLK